MSSKRKEVEVLLSDPVSKKLDQLKQLEKTLYDFIIRELKKFKNEFPITECADVFQPGPDGTRKFVVDKARSISFAGWAEENEDVVKVHIERLFY